ncbi:hypothetical protein SAMN02745157_2300 [Kaistia soli DSM 19436]|uniref:Uncharacterized protein n=1 Tax=Kaistia soli DSM 19436 TaxID=1122133 RepID=A0A1M5CCF9_9HYPH|nr:hypothetical protein [Kaistia soli]SHF52428.1 hypothetical protein SAMN02745157_2300 [Kaistia soli DSM 19436]
MLKSALITAATAVAITAGVFGVSSASAEPYRAPAPVQVDQRDWQGHRGPGWNGNQWHGERHVRGPVRVCKPILRTVKVRGYNGWHSKRVVVGERCHFVRRGW